MERYQAVRNGYECAFEYSRNDNILYILYYIYNPLEKMNEETSKP